jgi:hypothetical protein
MKNQLLIEHIQKTAFDFFLGETNFNPEPGFGMTVDHTEKPNVASIASVGFTLSAYVVGVSQGYIDLEDATKKVIRTLTTLRDHVSHYRGFFAHFIDIHTAQRLGHCEYSTIDTALALNGVITVDAYFKNETIHQLAKDIIGRIDFDMLIHTHEGKPRLYMAYNPDKDGDYVHGKPGFIHHWGMYAEQLMIYVMIAGLHHDHNLSNALYEGFDRIYKSYQQHKFIITPGNTLFVYQFPLAWLDLKNVIDRDGISWFDNTKKATYAHRAFCLRHQKEFKTFNQYSFGLTAGYTPTGYYVANALPNLLGKYYTNGTISPSAIVGSLPMAEDICLPALKHMAKQPELWGKYGLVGSYNYEQGVWISTRDYALDKGLELLMSNAYLTQDVQKAYMSHPIIQKGMEVLGWKKIEKK